MTLSGSDCSVKNVRIWYFDNPQFDLEKIFPESPFIQFANHLFKKCIVEHEKDCLPDATTLLKEVDETLSIIDYGGDLFEPHIQRRCKVCGIGNYKLDIDDDNSELGQGNVGLHSPYYKMKIFLCDNCGNAQLFAFNNREGLPPTWNKRIDLRGKRR